MSLEYTDPTIGCEEVQLEFNAHRSFWHEFKVIFHVYCHSSFKAAYL